MLIYLPIAEVSVNAFVLLGLGGLIGLLSGLFGVGGGFLMTPLLMLVGIPPAVAVATGANQICAASFSGVLAHWRRGAVDFRMGGVLLAGGVAGSFVGVEIFELLTALGQVELMVSLTYVLFLGVVGGLMLIESLGAMIRARRGTAPRRRQRRRVWAHKLPLKMRFRASNLYISVIPPFLIGALVGLLSAIMGVGGGFIMVPAMIYMLGMPTAVVVGTSLFQIMFVTGVTTLLHATQTFTVDIALALLLLVGGVTGAQVGARFGMKLKAEQLRIGLALMVLAVCLKIAFDLVATPAELYSLAAAP
ncbi:MAG: permease [Rhodobacteraceae bacterium]|nr:permease [Paracoccaceae bacterium]